MFFFQKLFSSFEASGGVLFLISPRCFAAVMTNGVGLGSALVHVLLSSRRKMLTVMLPMPFPSSLSFLSRSSESTASW